MHRRKRCSSTPASYLRGSARVCCAPKPQASRRSPRSALCGETSRDELGKLGVAVVARDVERGAAAPGPLGQVDALPGDEQRRRELIVALDRVEELAVVVVAQAHRG